MITQKRKGISTFIATLLLMVLAVSAGVVIYAYTMGYLGSFGGPQTMGAISIDTSSLSPGSTGTGLTAYIRNIGKTTFIPNSIYVNGIKIVKGALNGWSFTGPVAPTDRITEGAVGTLAIVQNPYTDETTPKVAIPNGSGTADDGFQGSTTYEIKIVGEDNTQLSFQVKK